MNDHVKIEALTEQVYVARKRSLTEELRAAEDRHRKASLQLHEGQITEEEAAKAASAAGVLRMKINGLDAAWAEAQRLAGLEAVEAKTQARRQSAKRVQRHASEAEKAFEAVLDHAAGFEPLLDAYSEALAQIAGEIRQNRDLYRQEDFGEALRALNERGREGLLVEGRIFFAGLGSWGVGNQQNANQARDWQVSGGLAFKRGVIQSLIQRLLGDEGHG